MTATLARTLVTGGAGFIGSALVRRLIRQTSYEVLNLDKLTYAPTLTSLESVSADPRYIFVKADICDSGKVVSVLRSFDPDVIVHLAAESHVDRSIDGPADFIQTNIVGAFTLLQAALGHYRRLPPERREIFRFHHVSTDEVFGSLGATGYLSVPMPAGIRDILIICPPELIDSYRTLFGDGSQYGIKLGYAVQPRPEGLAQAFVIGRDFVGYESVTPILGDNLFFGAGLGHTLKTLGFATPGEHISTLSAGLAGSQSGLLWRVRPGT